MRIGITRHMHLTPAIVCLVRETLDAALSSCAPERTTGVSCIAEGADTEFAQAVLDAGRRPEALLPAPDYRDTRVSKRHLPVFDAPVEAASEVRYVAEASSMETCDQANKAMIATVDRIVAGWDGQPSSSGKRAALPPRWRSTPVCR